MGDPAFCPPPAALDRALEVLRAHERPVIIAGHGARFAMDEVIALAEELGCPVLTTFKGKGLIPDDHPLAAGVLGRSGTPVASYFMNEDDQQRVHHEILVMRSMAAAASGIPVDFSKLEGPEPFGLQRLWNATKKEPIVEVGERELMNG